MFASPLDTAAAPVPQPAPTLAFHSSSGGWNFHSLLAGPGVHSLWPQWLLGEQCLHSLPPKAKFHSGNVWVVPIASLKSCGCDRCRLTQHGDENSSRLGIDVPDRKWICTDFISSKLSQVERRASPHKTAGGINSTPHYLWLVGPCVSFFF